MSNVYWRATVTLIAFMHSLCVQSSKAGIQASICTKAQNDESKAAAESVIKNTSTIILIISQALATRPFTKLYITYKFNCD